MQYIKEITVDLSGEMYFNYITAVQGDENSRFVKITILSSGTTFTPPEGATAILRARKPDGTFILNTATIEQDGTITAELTGNMLSAVGNCRCEVSIYEGESCLTTVPFIIKVNPGAVDTDIEHSNEYTALMYALTETDAAIQASDEAVTRNNAATNAAIQRADNATSAANAATQNADAAALAANTAAAAAHEAAEAVGDEIDGIVFKDTDNNVDYLAKFRLIGGKPAIEYTEL